MKVGHHPRISKNFSEHIKPSADIPLQSSIVVLFFVMNMVHLERETGYNLWVNNDLEGKRLSLVGSVISFSSSVDS